MMQTLLPERHPNKDFFIADIFDALPIKNDRHTMEYPFFTLSTKPDVRTVRYKNRDISITLNPHNEYGLPTMMDKDILLYCGSHLMNKLNKRERERKKEAEKATARERSRVKNNYQDDELEIYLYHYYERYVEEQRRLHPIPKTLRFSAHDLMVTTNRMTNGQAYFQLRQAFSRLTGCLITTNIESNNKKWLKGFHMLESFEVIEKSQDERRMVRLEVTVSDWYYNAIIGKEFLTINRNYFRLRKNTERRLYELARKHCGKQKEWTISLDNLLEKSGSRSELKKFRFHLRKIINNNILHNHFPDYTIKISEKDIVTFTNRNFDNQNSQLSMGLTQYVLKPETREKAQNIIYEAGTNWDYWALEEQFITSISKGRFTPDNNDAAFIGFVKKKVQRTP